MDPVTQTAEQAAEQAKGKRAAGSIPAQLEALNNRVAAIEQGGNANPNEDSIRGTLRTFHDRITGTETSISAWAMMATALDQRLTALEGRLKALETAAAAPKQ